MKKILIIILSVLLLLPLFSCKRIERQDDIVILFTNDIHCGIDEGVTFAGIAAYKEMMQKKTPYVTLVDCGDAVSGSFLGTVSKGEVIVEAMNVLGYDFAILGNHEFDQTLNWIPELTSKANAQYLGCNLSYSGSGENPFKDIKPYKIVSYGDTKIAYIGVTTPLTVQSTTPAYLMENGEFVVSFESGDYGQNLCKKVQYYVDEARSKGANYVILLAHVGDADEAIPYRGEDLITGTHGIDALLDGHSHAVFVNYALTNDEGENVVYAQTGTKLANLGQLIIDTDGVFTVTNISQIDEKDEECSKAIEACEAKYAPMLEKVVAHSDLTISILDENGVRAVRNRETAIGNLCSDALRIVLDADIAFVNGGGIRADIPEGDIKYSDVLAVMPYGNTVCTVEVTGAEVLDMLEYFCATAMPQAVDENGKAVGENGSFANMSGLTFTLNTKIPTPVKVDESDLLIGVSGQRRVSDVKVLDRNSGEYVPIDTQKTYVLAASDYVILKGGSGMLYFLKDHKVPLRDVMTDYEALAKYITEYLGGDLSAYSKPAGRINFIR